MRFTFKKVKMPRLGFLLLIATFLVWDAQAQQQGCGSSADFIFVLDSSGSLVDQPLRSNNWAFIQEFLQTAVLNIAETVERDYPGAAKGLRFGLVQFRDVGVITIGLDDFTDYTEAARVMGLATNLGGQTNMAAGLEEASRMMVPQRDGNVRKSVVIVVSDWSPFNETVRRNSISTARRLESEYGATIVTVGVLGSVDQQFLIDVSTNRRNVMSENHELLLTHISPLINVVCETPDQGGGGTCERDVVFALDASYSLSQQQDFTRLKNFVAQVAGNIYQTARDTRMGVVTFSSNAKITIPLQMYSQDFVDQINAIQFDSKLTNHADALRKAREMLENSTRSKFVIIFTDGMTTEEQGQEGVIAQAMRQDGYTIIAFGVSEKIDYATLEKLVGREKSGTNIFWSVNYQTNMISKLNTLTQTAESCPARDLPCDARPPEVIVALDASGSIKDKGPNNWNLMQDFGVAVVETLRRSYPNSRVGALVFSDYAMQLIGLTDDTNAVVQQIRLAEHINGFTNEADALRVGIQMLSNARDPSYKYFILVTDGQPTLEIGLEVAIAEQMEQEGITRIMIGVTNDIERDRLTALGSTPSNRYVLFTENFDTLNAVPLVSAVVTAAGQCQGPQPTPPPRQCFGADVVLVMDSSGSIEEKGRGNFDLLKQFTANLARSIALKYSETRFGLVLFSDEGRVISSLNDYRSIVEFIEVVERQAYSGYQTNIASAIRVAARDVRQYGRNNPQIVLITDGDPTAEMSQTISEADETRQAGVMISAVGITNDVNSQTLTRITGDSNRVFMTPQFSDLQREIVQVTQVACQGSRAISPCSGNVDVVFCLDASGSIMDLSPTAWNDALDLVKAATSAFYSFNRNTHFGLVIFSDSAREEIPLSGNMEDVQRRIDAATYDRGRTNIAHGIELARTQVFARSRPGASKILVLITDGEPNERIRDTEPQADQAKRAGIMIVTVGITEDGPDYPLLGRIASNPQQVIRSLSFASLNREIGNLIQASCISGLTTRPNPNIIPQFTTKPSRNGFDVTTRRPFFFFFPQQTTPLDGPKSSTPQILFSLQASCSGGYVILVIDVSRRLHYKTLPNRGIEGLREMAADIVEVLARLNKDARFAVVTYAGIATIVRDFNAYRSSAELQAFLQQLVFDPAYESNIAAGFSRAKEVINRARTTSSMVILISDGETTRDQGIEQTRADELRALGAKVLVIAVSRNYRVSQLNAITNNDPPHFTAETFRFDANLLNYYYKPCRTPNSVANLRSSNVKVCADEIVFVVDSSSSMNGNDWDSTKKFLIALVERFEYYTPGTKFGSVLFGNNSQLGFYLSNDIPDIKMRIKSLRQMGGETNIAAGLSAARRYVFNNNAANKLLVLMVDGDPTVQIDATYKEADLVRSANIDVVVVGITYTPSKYIMEQIAGSSEKTVRCHDFNYLESEVDKIVRFGCTGGDNDVEQQQTPRPAP